MIGNIKQVFTRIAQFKLKTTKQQMMDQMHKTNVLDEIKQMIETELTKIRENAIKKNGKNAEKHGQKYSHIRLSELEKQNKVLTYQLMIYRKLVSGLKMDDKLEPYFVVCEAAVNNQIKHNVVENLKKQNVHLNELLEECKRERSMLKQQGQENKKKQNYMRQKMVVLEKKSAEFDKLGGFSAFQTMKQSLQKVRLEFKKCKESQKQLKEKATKLGNKCKILESLNWKTEMQLADLRVQRQNNPKTINQPQEKKNYRDYMAAKQEIRVLKAQVDRLQRQITNIKECHEQKQGIYSKLILR